MHLLDINQHKLNTHKDNLSGLTTETLSSFISKNAAWTKNYTLVYSLTPVTFVGIYRRKHGFLIIYPSLMFTLEIEFSLFLYRFDLIFNHIIFFSKARNNILSNSVSSDPISLLLLSSNMCLKI